MREINITIEDRGEDSFILRMQCSAKVLRGIFKRHDIPTTPSGRVFEFQYGIYKIKFVKGGILSCKIPYRVELISAFTKDFVKNLELYTKNYFEMYGSSKREYFGLISRFPRLAKKSYDLDEIVSKVTIQRFKNRGVEPRRTIWSIEKWG
jgi:hypothetical protein